MYRYGLEKAEAAEEAEEAEERYLAIHDYIYCAHLSHLLRYWDVRTLWCAMTTVTFDNMRQIIVC